MDLDVLFDNNEIIEKQEELTKEENNERGVRANYIQPSQLRSILISDYNGGSNIVSGTCSLQSSGTAVYLVFYDDSNNLVYGNYVYINNITPTQSEENGVRYVHFKLFDADYECIGIDCLRNTTNSNWSTVITPKISVEPENPTVSGNSIDYTEYLETIIERLEGIEEDVQSISNNIISACNDSNNNNNSQVGSVSQNILTTPINEYGLTDSLLFIGLGVAFVTLVIVVVRRLIYRWN